MSISQSIAVGSLVIAGLVICAAPPQPDSTDDVDGVFVDESLYRFPTRNVPRESSAKKTLVRGTVVLWRDALKKRGITSFEEFDKLVAIETTYGQLLPIVPDWRGRAFFQDEKLRDREVELVGYRRSDTSTFQVLMIFTFDKDGKRQYTDYWCDICSIPMYEIKPCDCCQADIRLRYQPQDLPDYITARMRTRIAVGDHMERVLATLELWGAKEWVFARYPVIVPTPGQTQADIDAAVEEFKKAREADPFLELPGYGLPNGLVIDVHSRERKLIGITKHILGEHGKADDRKETGYTSLTYNGEFILGRDKPARADD